MIVYERKMNAHERRLQRRRADRPSKVWLLNEITFDMVRLASWNTRRAYEKVMNDKFEAIMVQALKEAMDSDELLERINELRD